MVAGNRRVRHLFPAVLDTRRSTQCLTADPEQQEGNLLTIALPDENPLRRHYTTFGVFFTDER